MGIGIDEVSLESGDGTPGGDFNFRFDVLPGDVDDSDFVLNPDKLAVNQNQFNYFASPTYDPFTDIDGSGFVLNPDGLAINSRQFTYLPIAAPTPPLPVATTAALLAFSEPSTACTYDENEASASTAKLLSLIEHEAIYLGEFDRELGPSQLDTPPAEEIEAETEVEPHAIDVCEVPPEGELDSSSTTRSVDSQEPEEDRWEDEADSFYELLGS